MNSVMFCVLTLFTYSCGNRQLNVQTVAVRWQNIPTLHVRHPLYILHSEAWWWVLLSGLRRVQMDTFVSATTAS
jgi:hypothetical protein